MTLELMFVVAVALSLYPLIGYPVVLWIATGVRSRPVRRAAFEPTITVLIPAYNEADCIARTVEAQLAQDYPREKLQILVISDGSDDGTDDIVRRYADRGVELHRREDRKGKAAGLNHGVQLARGELVVFSDANASFAPDALRRMAENFADPDVGYVTGSLHMRHGDGQVAGQGNSAYLRYENALRQLETRAGSVIGVNGGVDVIRKALYQPVPADQITDFVLPLHVIAAGKRVVYDERVRSSEDANEAIDSEFRMRVRVALRALRGLVYMKKVLNPLRYPFAAFCILSHKILRYLSFVALLAALVLNAVLATRSPFFAWLLGLQVVAYAAAVLGVAGNLPPLVRKITALPTYFVVSNAAFAVAVLRFLRGDVMATWKPRAG